MNGSHYSRTAQSITTITITTITAVAATYALSKVISSCGGIGGTLRYIWEGDHLPPHIREAVDALDDLEYIKLVKQKKKLDKVEIMVEVARLNSVDDGEEEGCDSGDGNSATMITDEKHEMQNQPQGQSSKSKSPLSQTPTPALSKDLSMLSYTLDKLAAEIDSVQSCGDADVKRRKKEISKAIVKMMEKVDGYLKECGLDS
mmetsp:Transcript_1540/g.2208  ORF Transcript_1540/g.2208 Transcript_1540/m.2208 type:complete len:202 (+) Transcript_1540:46-651(+)|eukprot:CAMPEP_0203666578 /NCGR_PEP_ID=MMETSP0090-20130426/3589_1 /ASSEMBLY_ACC=CAM_ASM_001088 /TAXON_ID=426623 /ORGANISM="Chaetoceros affinis, Strain CCMP159" /LENGTH=201 /DNA_ID=CAMNT_0050530503 /DNA_START=36 /DNA_END=641 /DNA_ORIENTATION=+